jgi:7-cyano-7-deazaguanine synthase in queuosine biosynthesis
MFRLDCEGQERVTIMQDAKRGSAFSSSLSSSVGPDLISPLARDILRVGQAAFLADRAFRRGNRLGQQMRRLRVTIPVENPRRWRAISLEVERLAEFVSHDVWRFDFVPLKQRAPSRSVTRPKLRYVSPYSSILLFSNGLDSLCGLAAAMKRGEVPILVSHSPPGRQQVIDKSTALTQSLEGESEGPLFFNFYFKVHDRDSSGKRSLFPERSRRTRPMLFLCMAGAVALELNVRKIHLNENGVLAVNLPFRAHLNGPQISRHAHPETLRRFEHMLKRIWPHRGAPIVSNPFSDCTKAEELGVLGNAGHLAKTTVSCEYAGQQVAHLIKWLRTHSRGKTKVAVKECGLCMPCLIRRTALRAAGFKDQGGRYAFDYRIVFRNPVFYANSPLFSSVSSHVRTLHDFCWEISSSKPSDFMIKYAYELSLACEAGPAFSKGSKEIFALYQRFASEVLPALERR